MLVTQTANPNPSPVGLVLLGCALALAACGPANGSGPEPRPDGGQRDDGAVSDGETGDANGPTASPFDGPYPFDVPAEELLAPAIAAPGTWQWIDIPGAVCRSGSQAGFYLRIDESLTSKDLSVGLSGGNACFDKYTCAELLNASTVRKADIESSTLPFDEQSESELNPFRTWNRVFVPYCTGDLHAGRATNAVVCEGDGCPGPQQFVGHRNMELYLHVLRSYFSDAERVVIYGKSAGGFGAVFNYHQTAQAFAPIHPTLIDDSGPVLADKKVFSDCLANHLQDLWGTNASMPTGCDECRGEAGLRSVPGYLTEAHPDSRFGFVSPTRDPVIVAFMGLQTDPGCTPRAYSSYHFALARLDIPTALMFAATQEADRAAGLADFTKGLETFRAEVAPSGRWSTFYITSEQHTFNLGWPANGTTVGGWMQGVVDGDVGQLGP